MTKDRTPSWNHQDESLRGGVLCGGGIQQLRTCWSAPTTTGNGSTNGDGTIEVAAHKKKFQGKPKIQEYLVTQTEELQCQVTGDEGTKIDLKDSYRECEKSVTR